MSLVHIIFQKQKQKDITKTKTLVAAAFHKNWQIDSLFIYDPFPHSSFQLEFLDVSEEWRVKSRKQKIKLTQKK